MSFFYENQGIYKYLVYKFEENEIVDSLSLSMVTNNKIEELVPLVYIQADDNRFVKYNISAKVSLTQILTDTINKQQMLKIIKGIVSSFVTVEGYMLETDSLMLKEDYIFVDSMDGKVWMTYLPVVKAIKEKEAVVDFLKRIIFSGCYDQTENSDYIAELICYLNRKQGFLAKEFIELIGRLMRNDNKNCLSVQTSNNKAIVTELTYDEDKVYDVKNKVLVNNNSDDSYWYIDADTAGVKQEVRMTFKYLITHYSKENRLKFIEQRRQSKANYLKRQEMFEQQKQDLMFNNHMFTTTGGKVELIKKVF